MAKYTLYRTRDWTDPRGKQMLSFSSLCTGEKMHETEIDLGPPVFHPAGEVGYFTTKASVRKAIKSGEWSEQPWHTVNT